MPHGEIPDSRQFGARLFGPLEGRLITLIRLGAMAASLTAAAAAVGAPAVPVSRRASRQAMLDYLAQRRLHAKPFSRPALPSDYAVARRARAAAPSLPGLVLRDLVVSNTDPGLNATDEFADTEPSIAVNPLNPNEIVITAFSNEIPAYRIYPDPLPEAAPLWQSRDGGASWTKRFNVPTPFSTAGPPGLDPIFVSNLCFPCDQSIGYSRSGLFFSADIAVIQWVGGEDFIGVTRVETVAGSRADVAGESAWKWGSRVDAAAPVPDDGSALADQPLLHLGPDPRRLAQDLVYVSYVEFVGDSMSMRVAVAAAGEAPQFTRAPVVGTLRPSFADRAMSPGLRIAADPRLGDLYSIYTDGNHNDGRGHKSIAYYINHSADGGTSWSIRRNPGGAVLAVTPYGRTVESYGGFLGLPKFATVQRVGGANALEVDPVTGAIYFIYSSFDEVTGNNRLMYAVALRTPDGPVVITTGFVSGQLDTALPTMAIASNGTVGVLYYTHDGFSADGYPILSVHLSTSRTLTRTWRDNVLQTFTSAEKDNGDPLQQSVLGDYMQVRAVGNNFYGVYTANGLQFGRPFTNHDPIFFKVPAR